MREKRKEPLLCPHCNKPLSFMMPSGSVLYCNGCDKYFENDNEKVGKECDYPYPNNNVLY